MKVYNITFSRNDFNYGQRLQTYALQRFMKNNCNVDVTTIDPRPFSSDFTSFEKECMNVEYINWNNQFFNNLTNKDYCVVFGGDQIWNLNCSGDSIGWYVGDYIPTDISRFSYSASLNKDFRIIHDAKLLNSISKFKGISVREKLDSDELNKKFIELHQTPISEYHIDPALLLTKQEWGTVMRRPSNKMQDGAFDFEYLVGWTNEDRVENGIHIYTSSGNTKCKEDKYDPREWIWMVANCRKLITSSFHGFVFGLIFNKQFSKTDWSDNYRVQNLINVLGIKLEGGIIQNYDQVMKKINNERIRSNEYLSRCLTQQNIWCSSATNIQVLVQLLKKFNIRHGIINPGATHGAFVASILNDPFFKCYSVIDERSASYMAVGMSRQLNEPVFIACTGATASRNYIPGATEAFYSHAKVLYITGDYGGEKGMNSPQQIDRSQIQKDITKKSYVIDGDLQTCRRRVSEGINYMLKDEGGPVHFNLISNNWCKFTDKLMQVEPIQYYDNKTIELPLLSNLEKISVYIESSTKLSKSEIELINEFCEKYNAICLQNSNNRQKGLKYAIQYSPLVKHGQQGCLDTDILIYYGIPYSEYDIFGINKKKTWMVGMNDGKFIDPFNNLSNVFDMSLSDFLQKYVSIGQSNTTTRFEMVKKIYDEVYKNQYEKSLPFSTIWIAKKFSSILPENSNAYFSVLNTYRSWNYWECKANTFFRNQGGYGIDGVMSSVIGQSIVSDELHFCFIGDSAFFYDLNSLGVHYIKPNLRICIMNNGGCVEFNTPGHFCSQFKGNDWHSEMMMAKSHYGNKSRTLVKHYAEDLGFKYISASNKQEFELVYNEFIKDSDKPIVFECFIDDTDDAEALRIL